jgi:hypothetical protein
MTTHRKPESAAPTKSGTAGSPSAKDRTLSSAHDPDVDWEAGEAADRDRHGVADDARAIAIQSISSAAGDRRRRRGDRQSSSCDAAGRPERRRLPHLTPRAGGR